VQKDDDKAEKKGAARDYPTLRQLRQGDWQSCENGGSLDMTKRVDTCPIRALMKYVSPQKLALKC
jgi:hypothetical protein